MFVLHLGLGESYRPFIHALRCIADPEDVVLHA